jgi:plastocyanin
MFPTFPLRRRPLAARRTRAADADTAAVVAVLACAAVVGIAAPPARADEPIEIRIRDHRFVPDVVEVPANTKFRLLVINEDADAEEFESYVLNREKVVRPGGRITVFLPPLKAGEYGFFGEFHPETAKGKIVAR